MKFAIVGVVVIIMIAVLEIWNKYIPEKSAHTRRIKIAVVILGAVLAVAMIIIDEVAARKPIVSPEEKEALSPKIHIGFSPIYDDPDYSPKYPLYAYSFLVRNDNKESASITDLAISFVFKYEIEKTNAGSILDTGGPIIDGLIITETEGERLIVTEDGPQEIPPSGAPELRVKPRTVNGKPVNTSQADLACAKWPRGCVFRGRVVVNLEKPMILPGRGTYFGKYHYQIKDEIFTKQIGDVIPEPNDTLLKAEWHYKRGLAHAEKGQYDEAIGEYDQAIGLNSRHSDAFFHSARAHGNSKQYDEAIQDYSIYLQICTQSPEGHFGRGLAFAWKGENEAAISDFDQAIRLNPQYGEAYLDRGNVYARPAVGEYDKAISDYNKASDLIPGMREEINVKLSIAHTYRGISLASKNKHNAAIADFTHAVKLKADLHEPYYHWGNSLYQLAKTQEHPDSEVLLYRVCEKYEKAIQLKPNFPEAYNNWGTVLGDLARSKQDSDHLFGSACEKYEKAIEIKPDYNGAYNNWGNTLWELAKTKGAADSEAFLRSACEKYEKATEIKPGDHEPYSNWGNALYDLAKNQEGAEADVLFRNACAKYKQATELKPDFHVAYFNWANCLLHFERKGHGVDPKALLRAACEKYEKTTEIEPAWHDPWKSWGIALGYLGRRKDGSEAETLLYDACNKFEKAVEAEADDCTTYDNWASALILLYTKKPGPKDPALLDQAKDKALEAETIKTGSAAYNLACIAALQGNENQCRKWLEAAEVASTIPTRDHAMNDPHLESVRDRDWFKDIKWKVDK